ncbi:MAG: class I SAM-dependent methyltransferase [Ilumatobacter sp.]|uniref:class I SAM-dependent methyltransferase n=1 Tax=Ilumatobacter sp. TaxID=1967498 RepID=UPI00391C406C
MAGPTPPGQDATGNVTADATGNVTADATGDVTADDEPSTSARPIYNVPFSWESSHGHIVELLMEHAPNGIIVDVGCGYAPHAERLEQRGFRYVGVDADPDAVAHLRTRGFEAAVADANDVVALLDAMTSVVDAAPEHAAGDPESAAGPGPDADQVSAVLALDVLEHLVTPHLTLAGIRTWMTERRVPLFGVSLPNVSHADVVLKLLSGRFDMTPSGLLDHTHLRFFTDRTVGAMFGSVAMVEVARHDVSSPKSDQEWPDVHPMLSDGALLGSHLRQVRALGDAHGDTFQFVRLFAPDLHRAVEPTLLATVPPRPRHAVTALVAADCSDGDHDALAEQLAAQTSGPVETIRLRTVDDLESVIASIPTSYVAILRGGERLAGDWAEQFLAVARRYPAATVRSGPLAPDHDALAGAESGRAGLDIEWPARFALFDHYLAEVTPSAAIAFPTAFLRETSTQIPTSPMDLDAHALLVEATMVCGVVDTRDGTVAAPAGWRRSDDAARETLERLGSAPLLAGPGAAVEVATILRALRISDARVAELERDIEALRVDSASLNAELQRRPIKAIRRIADAANRLRR